MVHEIVDYIFRNSYQYRPEPHNLDWNPESAPRGEPCIVVAGNENILWLFTATKWDEWMSLETENELPFKVLAYVPYAISWDTFKRARALLDGTEYKSEF